MKRSAKSPACGPRPQYADPVPIWLKQQGLRGNPFGKKNAKYEDNIPSYYVSIQGLQIENLLSWPDPWIVFAAVGRGKTALRKMVSAECWPANLSSSVLALEFKSWAWDQLKGMANTSVPLLRIHCAQVILRLALRQFKRNSLVRPADLTPLEDAAEAAPANLRSRPCLEHLHDLAGRLGFSRVVCLVDELDSVFADASPETLLDWVQPLLHPEIRNCLTLRYFLPDTVDEPLLRESRNLYLSACEITRVRWEEGNLVELLAQRMRAFSKDQSLPLASVGQLCEERLRTIDHEIAQTAESSPRAAIYLADRLLNLHCRAQNIAPCIQIPTWRQVEREWQTDRARVLGVEASSGGEAGFCLKGQSVYFAGSELRLIGRDYLLLRHLVEAGGQVCSLRDLAAAAWPNDDPDGVLDKTVQEAVRRMKERLKEQKVDPTWVDAVPRRGYRLRGPEETPPDEYAPLVAGLEEVKRRLTGKRPAYEEALVHETHLRGNIERARRYGDEPALQADRAEIADCLNALCFEALGVYFSELCGQTSAGGRAPSGRQPGKKRGERQDGNGS